MSPKAVFHRAQRLALHLPVKGPTAPTSCLDRATPASQLRSGKKPDKHAWAGPGQAPAAASPGRQATATSGLLALGLPHGVLENLPCAPLPPWQSRESESLWSFLGQGLPAR